MITHNYTRLMFPEPDATGGGEVAENTETQVETQVEETPETKTESNPFLDALNGNPDEQPEAKAEQEESSEDTNDDEYDFGDVSELGLEESELSLLREAGKASGITPAQTLSLVTKIRDGVKQREDEANKQAFDALKESWGSNYTQNMQSTAAFINRVAKACNWTPEQVQSMATAGKFKLFYDVFRYVNNGASGGNVQYAPVQAKPQKSFDELKKEAANIGKDFWRALDSRDLEKARKLSDEHYAIQKELYGADAYRHLDIR